MLDFLANIDSHLLDLITKFGIYAYLLFFLVVFCENGVIPMILLPGDGFLFSLGVVAKAGAMEITILWPLLLAGAILGYQFNYWVGSHYGLRLLQNRKWVKREHLERTQRTFDLHGRKAVFICRFIPIARTIIPFLAGLAKMPLKSFVINNLLGASIWLSSILMAGYFLGGIPFVQENIVWFFLGMIITTTAITTTGILIGNRRKPIDPNKV